MMKYVSDPDQISRLVLHRYKSIAEYDPELGRPNILISANGAGKSNFIGFFRLMNRILDQQLQTAVGLADGPDTLLHYGRKKTEELRTELYFGNNGHQFTLRPTQDNRMMFAHEALWWNMRGDQHPASGRFETYYKGRRHHEMIWDFVVPAMRSWHLYHFHDTGGSALVKQIHNVNDNEYLRGDARNLAAFLLRLEDHHDEHYQRIVKAIRLVAPFFDDFHLGPTVDNKKKTQPEWTEQGQDEPFTTSALSDDTLRLICLATVLLQPEDFMPVAILIDEPELGPHLFTVSILAGLMKSASQKHQLIVSTQSVGLVNEFDAEDLIVVDERDGASNFARPDAQALSE